MVVDQFEHTGATKTLKRLRIRWRLAKLNGKERHAEGAHARRAEIPADRGGSIRPRRAVSAQVRPSYIYTYICIIVNLKMRTDSVT